MAARGCLRLVFPAAAAAVAWAVVLAGSTSAQAPPRGTDDSAFRAAVNISALPPAVLARLRESPHSYFRFVNKPWTQAVCDEYGTEIARLPQVRLHGDAHVEQYAVTADSRGLDDFDDSALGPAVVDIVRFLGSLQLVARQAGWQKQERTFFDAFFRGYERALANPAYTPKEPAVVKRLRARPVKAPDEFLAWAESLMTEGSEGTMQVLQTGLDSFRRYALEQVAGLTESQIAIKKYGAIHMGIGSALTRKVLLRVEGPTPAPDDDVIIEAKELARLDSASCVSVPPPVEAFRVVTAASQLGRLHHRFLVVLPSADRGNAQSPGWWVRSWDRTYRELEVADIQVPSDLRQVAEDAGAQLGSANTHSEPGIDDAKTRKRELAAVRELRPQLRRTVARLTAEVFGAWQALCAQ